METSRRLDTIDRLRGFIVLLDTRFAWETARDVHYIWGRLLSSIECKFWFRNIEFAGIRCCILAECKAESGPRLVPIWPPLVPAWSPVQIPRRRRQGRKKRSLGPPYKLWAPVGLLVVEMTRLEWCIFECDAIRGFTVMGTFEILNTHTKVAISQIL